MCFSDSSPTIKVVKVIEYLESQGKHEMASELDKIFQSLENRFNNSQVFVKCLFTKSH